MSIDDSKKSSECPVQSKYFTDKPGMDESLSDFHETKKSCAGPKSTVKSKSSKTKKATKRIRGQKDIRTVLKSKKNELESYSKDFDNVCKKAGIDVDSEQLQIAIALSKSLQDTTSTLSEVPESSQLVTTQNRIGKIRTTLQEYGFKVPEVKIAINTRKVRKLRKNYKLLLTSDIEKKEIIAYKYSQILFHNINHCSLYHCDVDAISIPLYYLASNVPYNILKISDTFYVNNLIEKSMTTGNMLRDWAEIPGRPVSPQLCQSADMNFSEIECSQDELDIVLSGTLKGCKNIIINKCMGLFSSKTVANEGNYVEEKLNACEHENTLEVENNAKNVKELSASNQYRSFSPDMFDGDDDVSTFDEIKNTVAQTINNSSKINNIVAQGSIEIMDLTECLQSEAVKYNYHIDEYSVKDLVLTSNITKRKSNDLMELTECVEIQPNNYTVPMNLGEQLSQKSLKSNNTKRISNDFMEITECVATAKTNAQPLSIDDNIDLTQCSNGIEERIEQNGTNNKSDNLKLSLRAEASAGNIEIDLTESPENYVIELNNEKVENTSTDKKHIESVDLSQSSNTSDDLPFVSLSVVKDNSPDNTIIVDVNEYVDLNNRKTTSQQLRDQTGIHIDLTQYSENRDGTSHNQSFFEEYIHNHSESTEEANKSSSSSTEKEQYDPDKIYLAPSSVNNTTFNTDKPMLTINNKKCFSKKLSINLQDKESECSKVNLTQNSERKIHLNNSQLNSQTKSSRDTLPCKSDNVAPMQSPVRTTTSKHDHSNIIEECVCIDNDYLIYNNKQNNLDKINLTLSPIDEPNDKISDIDLTQNSNSSEELHSIQSAHCSAKSVFNDSQFKEPNKNVSNEEGEASTSKKAQRCSSLGKKDDISIDYDDFIEINKHSNSKSACSQSIIYEIGDEHFEKSLKNSLASNCSQNSEVFEISDKELDYSLNQSKLEMPQDNFAFGGISIMDDLSNLGTTKKSIVTADSFYTNNPKDVQILPEVSVKTYKKTNKGKEITPIKHRRIIEIATPQKAGTSSMVTVVTPQNSELIIKTNNVTPLPDYESMTMPEIHEELDKYGIKPFKRKRAIQLLTHIYNQTHPIIETYDNLESPPKRHKPNDVQPFISPKIHLTPKKLRSPRKEVNRKDDAVMILPEVDEEDTHKNVPNRIDDKETLKNKSKNKGKDKASSESKINKVTERIEVNNDVEVITEAFTLKEIECEPEDWVFQKREKAKVHSCRVPLHIAFHNYVASRRELREAILCYEPIEIDVIHKDLVGYGHRYDPKDLLKFLDKKCITVKTADNDARIQKR